MPGTAKKRIVTLGVNTIIWYWYTYITCMTNLLVKHQPKSCAKSCFGLECLDFEESSYSQLPGNLSRLQISACKANSSPNELSLPNHT